MVKRSFLPGQPLSPASPEVGRGPSRFLRVTSDRSRGSQTPLRVPPLSPVAPFLSPQPITRRRLLPGPAGTMPLHGYVCSHITAPGPGLPDPPLSHYPAQCPRPEILLRSHGRRPPRRMRMAAPGQARLSLVRASPCLRLMRGPSRHHELFAASTRFSIVSSVGPAGHHQHRRAGRRWQAVGAARGTRRGVGCRQGPGGGLPSAALTSPAGVGDDATLEVRTYPAFTSSLEALADWLQTEGVTQVVMEATGQYWKPCW